MIETKISKFTIHKTIKSNSTNATKHENHEVILTTNTIENSEPPDINAKRNLNVTSETNYQNKIKE